MAWTRVLVAAALVACLAPTAPAGEEKIPEPPFAWLAPFAAAEVTSKQFDTLRVKLLRTEEDADVIRGLSWLVHAKRLDIRHSAAATLASSYILGAHLGADPAPALRRLARDPELQVRSSVFAALRMHDTPLARELLLRAIAETLDREFTEEVERYHESLERWARHYGGLDALADLSRKDAEAVADWIEEAIERPATASEGRFQTGVMGIGKEDMIHIDGLSHGRMWVAGSRRMASLAPYVTSGDSLMAWLLLHPKSDAKSGMGGAKPYMGGVSSSTGFSLTMRLRYLGKQRVRYWLRVDRQALAEQHLRRGRKRSQKR